MKSYETTDTRAYLAYIAVCLVWGSTYLAIRIGVSEMPPALFAGLRFLLAGFIMLAYVYIKKLKLPQSLKDFRITASDYINQAVHIAFLVQPLLSSPGPVSWPFLVTEILSHFFYFSPSPLFYQPPLRIKE